MRAHFTISGPGLSFLKVWESASESGWTYGNARDGNKVRNAPAPITRKVSNIARLFASVSVGASAIG
jgi:hypothetical protein